jgi:AGZA family xanthine/uracil permease-like MFS transporter
MYEDEETEVKPTTPAIGTALFAPDIVNGTSNDSDKKKSAEPSVFILYYLFPGLEQLVDKFSSRLTLSFPPAPPELIPYRDYVDNFFEIKKKGTTFQVEVLSGLINFFSSMYVLAVIPNQMALAGYDAHVSVSIVGLITGIATIACGMISNTPLVIAPPTSLAIFFVVSLRQDGMSTHDGNMAVFYSGIMVLVVSFIGPIGIFLSKLIPETIQASTAMGVGLITCLAGYVEIGLIVQGQYSILSRGEITNEVCIATSGLILIAVLQFYQSKFSYLFGLVWGTFIWWIYNDIFPTHWGAAPTFRTDAVTTIVGPTLLLVIELFLLHMIMAFGLARALIELMGQSSQVTNPDKSKMLASIPKGRYIFIVIAVANIMSGLMYGPPIVISPESSAGIRAGAKTGLSAVVCGSIFCVVAINFGPLYAAIPPAGTSPVLIMVGLLLFRNVIRVDFASKYGIRAGAKTGLSAVVCGSIFCVVAINFGPLYAAIPPAGTSPVLIMVGLLLFRNVIRVDFASKYGMPAFVCLGLIPFTNSAVCGIAFAYVTYVAIAVITGDIALEIRSFCAFVKAYRNSGKQDVHSDEDDGEMTLRLDQDALENLEALTTAMENATTTTGSGAITSWDSQDSLIKVHEQGPSVGVVYPHIGTEDGEGLVTPPRSRKFNSSFSIGNSRIKGDDHFSPLGSQSGSKSHRAMSNSASPASPRARQDQNSLKSTLQRVEDFSFEPDVISGISKQVVL